ncbi:UDP-N-acetylglucosamine 2-epimerase (non-hydrolyzing) [Bacillus hwajinpoensis]|uniref:UDP-N-acetylglucosamine 2-epimerase (Non-hydrolyzing) n=1 Tax=Guptibacillus hwajinpoensis TaxID=208199 RepID=A0A845EYF4_9BACL|nr:MULTISPECIES: UDP-N-acetylglucosamine 2-epimerase (non-hydrolyzing) [Bacillaceae]MYL63557.1 UDP-N-acetylglucosamine 2-epimerase (non-hydrolyzing) [Pseudalkalibacillus hwajinpoensis]
MKVATILGTRPEIIRLSLIIEKLDRLAEEHIVIHTGQNSVHSLKEVFFKEMGIRTPDYTLKGNTSSLGEQLSIMFKNVEQILLKHRPDRILILGDTNSALCALLGERLNIPVTHMEAGNRCFDLNVPEEKNRKVIDAISSYNLPYTVQSKENLLREGFPSNRIYVTGNPIFEVLTHYKKEIERSQILHTLNLQKQDYFLVTVHRAENVDNATNLSEILNGLSMIADQHNKRMICSIHPRTRSKLTSDQLHQLNSLIELHEPFGFFDFIQLEKSAFCVLTDSGTVQEECCLFHIPAVTVRTTTERPETISCGSNIVSGLNAKQIKEATNVMINSQRNWSFPTGYDDPDVSDRVVKFVLGGMKIVP